MTGPAFDALMQASGLTRGAFYAHFRSKDALYEAVLDTQHPLLSRLQALPDAAPEALREAFRAYLAPGNQNQVARGCTFVALTGEVAKRTLPPRRALAGARQRVLAEMRRVGGPEIAPARLDAGLALATGALQAAAVEPDRARQAAILEAAGDGFDVLLSPA